MSEAQIRLLASPTDSEIDAITGLFVRAFYDSQFLRSVTGDASLFDPFFRCRILAAKYDGKLYIASIHDQDKEVIVGAAYWVPFDQPDSPEVLKAVKPLKDAYNRQVDPNVRKWWVEAFRPPVDIIVSKYVANCWHLKYLAVLPEYQRQGIGKALIAPLIQQACALDLYKGNWLTNCQQFGPHGVNFSLVTQTEENMQFYENIGFRVGGSTIVTGGLFGDIPVLVMIKGFNDVEQ